MGHRESCLELIRCWNPWRVGWAGCPWDQPQLQGSGPGPPGRNCSLHSSAPVRASTATATPHLYPTRAEPCPTPSHVEFRNGTAKPQKQTDVLHCSLVLTSWVAARTEVNWFMNDPTWSLGQGSEWRSLWGQVLHTAGDEMS